MFLFRWSNQCLGHFINLDSIYLPFPNNIYMHYADPTILLWHYVPIVLTSRRLDVLTSRRLVRYLITFHGTKKGCRESFHFRCELSLKKIFSNHYNNIGGLNKISLF